MTSSLVARLLLIGVAPSFLASNSPELTIPPLIDLKLKLGSQVMMLNNDINGRFINGTIGKIMSIDRDYEIPKLIILLETGKKVSITPYTWESYIVNSGEVGDVVTRRSPIIYRRYSIVPSLKFS